MAHRVFISAVSVYDTADPEGRTEVVRQGKLLPDWVDEYQRFVLSSTGMVKFEPDSDEPDPGADNPTNPAPVRLAEHPPLDSRLALSERGTLAGAAAQRLVDERDNSGDNSEVPAQSAPKAEWVEHAVARGADRDDAEAMTKAELVNKFGH
jgi:hypothetical protein